MAEAPNEDRCAPFSYVTGGVTMSPKPPSDFAIGVNILVGPLQAALKGPNLGDNHIVWQYLAVVRPGPVNVRCIVGDITIERHVEARHGCTEIVNFCFGQPVIVEPKNTVVSEGKSARRRGSVLKNHRQLKSKTTSSYDSQGSQSGGLY